MPMWGYPYGFGMGGMFWIIAGSLLVVSLLVWYALSLVERHERRERGAQLDSVQPGALETLQRRYARGEIDEPTFLRMREQLTPGEGVTPSEQATRR